jgi:hypothetical protein
MTVEFGTDDYGEVTFSLDDFAKYNSVSSSFEEKAKAYNLLYKTMNDETFIDDGHRNDDAVNCCIALHVLGYDPCEWFDNFFEDHDINVKFFGCDIEKFMDHVHRVCGYGPAYFTNYLFRWGPVGDEGAALGYAID